MLWSDPEQTRLRSRIRSSRTWSCGNPRTPTMMLEASLGTGVFAGAATEATNGCGSTRAKVRTGSYFVVGMHIDFGGAFDYRDFVALTRYKLTLLQTSVARALGRRAQERRRGHDDCAAQQCGHAARTRRPVTALGHVKQFLKLVDVATYKASSSGARHGIQLQRRSPDARREHCVHAAGQGHSHHAVTAAGKRRPHRPTPLPWPGRELLQRSSERIRRPLRHPLVV